MLSDEGRGMLLSYRPCMVTRVKWMQQEKARHKKWIKKKSFWPPWHAWHLNAWCGCDRTFLYLFHSNPSSHSSRGQTDCYNTLYYHRRSNTQRTDFLAFIVKVNSYGSSILHQIEVRLVQINSSLHGSFKFNKFYWRHELASIEIKGTHESLAYYRSDQR
jgi:hypothetical protein